MRTSNKIIAAILLAVFGYLTVAQVALHAKYADNKYITPDEYESKFYNQYKLAGINHVYVEDIAECHILPADAVKLSLEDGPVNYVSYTIHGDTLNVLGVYAEIHLNNKPRYNSSQDVRLYLPTGTDVRALNSNIDVKGNKEGVIPRSYRFTLDNCTLYTRMNSFKDSLNRYFDTIAVNARNNSRVELYQCEHIKMLNVSLYTSVIDDRYAQIGHITLIADRKSIVVLSGDNIKNLNSTIIK